MTKQRKISLGLGITILLLLGGWCWLRDEPLDPEAQAWLQAIHSPAGESAAYLFYLGFDAVLGDEPQVIGRERLSAYRQWSASHRLSDSAPLAAVAKSLAAPTDDELCGLGLRVCLERLQAGEIDAPAILQRHAELLQRYRQLLQLNDYRTLSPVGMSEPMAPFVLLRKANRLLALQAISLARTGQSNAARQLLEADIRQLRSHLSAADNLIMKMQLVALVAQDLETLSGLQQVGLLAELSAQAPLSAAERSLQMPLQREFGLIASGLLELPKDPQMGRELHGLQLLFKPQMSINDLLPTYARVAAAAELDGQAFQRWVRQPAPQMQRHRLRNPVGDILINIAGPNFSSYLARLHDLDARLRLFNVLSLLPADFTPSTASLAVLPQADSPYLAGDPPYWDSVNKTLCYSGPLPDKHGLRCLPRLETAAK